MYFRVIAQQGGVRSTMKNRSYRSYSGYRGYSGYRSYRSYRDYRDYSFLFSSSAMRALRAQFSDCIAAIERRSAVFSCLSAAICAL